MVTPYLPVPDTNGEEWDRLEPIVALDALIDLVVLGEYGGNVEGESKLRAKEGLLMRTAGATVFEVRARLCLTYKLAKNGFPQNYTRKEELRTMILQAMLPTDGTMLHWTPVPLRTNALLRSECSSPYPRSLAMPCCSSSFSAKSSIPFIDSACFVLIFIPYPFFITMQTARTTTQTKCVRHFCWPAVLCTR